MCDDVVLCVAPVMSVVRPSIGVGILQAGLESRGIKAATRYLNLDFAEICGLDLNEDLAERTPAHLLVGDWIFRHCVGPGGDADSVAQHEKEVFDLIARRGISDVKALRDDVAEPFVNSAAERILQSAPRIVGFSTMFQQSMASLAIAKAIKDRDPSVVIVFGGANCHGPMGAAMLRSYPQIDQVFTGEADFSFPTWVAQLLNGGEAERFSHDHDGATATSPIHNLDSIPIPQYRDYFARLSLIFDADRIYPSLPFEASRGCWWGQKHHCTFCGLNAKGMAFRAKSGPKVIEEINELLARHDVHRFAATDNILGMQHIEQVLRPLATTGATPLAFFFEVKANLKEEHIRLLADSGVMHVQPGIESLSDNVLGIMRKGVDTLHNVRFLRNCRQYGINVTWSILHGFPNENRADYRMMAEMVPKLEHLPPPTGLSPLRLDRFSPNFEQATELGFNDVRPVIAYSALHALPPSDIFDLAYFFEGKMKSTISQEDLDPLLRAVKSWRATWISGEPAQLGYIRIGDGMLLSDTRSVAKKPLHYLDQKTVVLLDQLREPKNVQRLIDDQIADHGHLQQNEVFDLHDLERMIAMLEEHNFVLRVGDVLLSLLIDTDNARTPPSDSALGWLTASQIAETEVV